MNNKFYSVSNPRSSGQLQSLSHYRDQELRKQNCDGAVADDGSLLEYEALELRIHPPNVRIDNDRPDHTVLIIDSANRPGTLVEVVQCLTELGLSVRHARISSDGGWFVDEFHVSETPTGRVTDPNKLSAIKKVLALPEHTGEPVDQHTVFQIAGPETPGLLAEVTQLLSHNGLEIRTAAAWTFNNRAAIVIGVTEQSTAVRNRIKLQRLAELLRRLMEKSGDNVAVSVEQVEGPVHHERRLHQLLLADEIQAWQQLTRLQRQHSLPFPGPVHPHPLQPDTDTEADQQVPSTPRQQWQQRMLPPLWSVDQTTGRPYNKEDLRLHLQLQQQAQQQQQFQQAHQQHQQQQWLAQMHGQGVASKDSAGGSFAAVDASEHLAPDTPARTAAELAAAPAGAMSSGDSTPAAMHQQGGAVGVAASGTGDAFTQAQQRAGAMQSAAPVAISTAAADQAAAAASAAAAAAAAQQASVDKLIALLQPPGPPLSHAISLPRDRQQQQQQQMQAGATGQQHRKSLDADRVPSSRAGDQAAMQQHDPRQQLQQQPAQQSKTAPLPQLMAPSQQDVDPQQADMLAGMAAGNSSALVLPPRPPTVHHVPGILPPAQLLIPGDAAGSAAAGPGGRHMPSQSAPSSPSVGPRGGSGSGAGAGSVFAAAAAGGTGGAGTNPAWSPRGMASASAAAGLLSPRAAPRVSTGVGAMGLQQQQHQQGQDSMASMASRQQSSPLATPLASVLDAPEVQIQHSRLFNYWLVEIKCRDRNKLFFDTVCTLSDMRYDIYHATIDSEACGSATQLFYIRPRFGECVWDEAKASVLKAMLVSAVQRRFPPGLRLHVFSGSTARSLQDLVSSFKRHRLTITRCKVRAYDQGSHTFYLLNQDGSLPSRQYVQMACQAAGGELVEAPLDISNPCVSTVLRSLDTRGRFAFSFVTQRTQQRAWAHRTQQQAGQLAPAPRGVVAPGGPIDISTGVLVGRGDGGVHGGGHRGVLALLRGDRKELQPEQQKQQAGAAAAASYNSDQQPSF